MFEGLFQPTHLVLILVIALIVLGPKRLPEIGNALGTGIREFRKATSDLSRESSTSMDGEAKPSSPETHAAMLVEHPTRPNGKACPRCASPNPRGSKFCNHCVAEMQSRV